jgi:hypothetical protein
MRHQRIEAIGAGAALVEVKSPRLSREQRLARWAELLEREPQRKLKALWRVEYVRAEQRALLRCDDSPISVAFADPVLRDDGLEGDTLGDAERFFELSSPDAHHLLCDCHYMGRMDGETVARRVRGAMRPPATPGVFGRLFG